MNLRDRFPARRKCPKRIAGIQRAPQLPKWRPDCFAIRHGRARPAIHVFAAQAWMPHEAGGAKSRRRAVRRHIQSLFRARKYRCRAARARTPPAIAFNSPRRPTAGARCVAAARFCRLARSTRRAHEAERTLAALAPFVARGVPIIGLEPSCLFSFRDEIPALFKSDAARQVAARAVLFEEFLAREAGRDGSQLPLAPTKSARCCTAIATRNRSTRWRRSRRC